MPCHLKSRKVSLWGLQVQRFMGKKCLEYPKGVGRAGWERGRPVIPEEAGALCAWVGGLDFISSTMRGH